MTLQASTPIELNEILTEFGAPPRTPLSAMVRGGAYVPADDISGENSGIPTSTPIQLSDFLSTNGNPNPYQIKDELLLPPFGGEPAVRLLCHRGNSGSGLFVASHDGSPTVADAATFVVDMKVRMGPNYVDEPINLNYTETTAIASYNSPRRRMSFWMGLTPNVTSPLAMFNAMFGWRVELLKTEETEGYGAIRLGHRTLQAPSYGYMQNGGIIEDAASDYSTLILPTTSNYVNFRFERGNPVNTISGSTRAADWICTVYEDDAWSTSYAIEPAQNGNHGFNQLFANNGGYLIMAIDVGHPSGNMQMDLGDIRVQAGAQTPPW